MDSHPRDGARRPPRLLILATLLGAATAVALLAAWQLLPLLAPQLVIRRSPWIWPMIRAEAYEVEDRDGAPAGAAADERASLVQRLHEEEWLLAALPPLFAALEHPDRRVRRTAIKALEDLWDSDDEVRTELGRRAIAERLLRVLDDQDGEVFSHAFALLLGTSDAVIAQGLLRHLPRASGLTGEDGQQIEWVDPFDLSDRPHGMRVLRLVPLVAAVMPWLDSGDPGLQRLACLVLGFSDDPRALDLLVARLGQLDTPDERLGVDDAVAAGLKECRDPRAAAAIGQALGDPLAGRRAAALRATRLRKDPATLPLLVAMQDDPDPAVRIELARALAAYPLEAVLDHLAAIIARGGAPALAAIEGMRFNLMLRGHALKRMQRKPLATIPEFASLRSVLLARVAALLPVAESAVRVALVEYVGLVKQHGEEGRRLLRGLADDPDPPVRAVVDTALERLGP
jgi:HEAT repeat protein